MSYEPIPSLIFSFRLTAARGEMEEGPVESGVIEEEEGEGNAAVEPGEGDREEAYSPCCFSNCLSGKRVEKICRERGFKLESFENDEGMKKVEKEFEMSSVTDIEL